MPQFTRAADTGLLVTLLMETDEGELLTYEEMNQHIGRDVRRNRSHLASAIRIALKEGAVFGCVPNEGYRRLPPGDVVALSDQARRRQHKIAHKACKQLATVSTERLNDSERRDYYTHLSIQGALAASTRAASVKQVAETVNGSTQQLAVARTLEALKQ